ncbi:BRO family protein [Streptococcus sp. NLN64]|uniref:BRO-N domain-containing protein n=2 Tax=Streptococcus sp. NLN64 TaxID=2822799 RepID=UPI0018C9EB28|nr:BRO family protein [Streptococcus sp. NLN64]MBG9368183.1 phage repressor protein [Streptococcus sp. NLN64]
MKTEQWNGYPIRFVDHEGEWWAVAKDITDALGIKNTGQALANLKGISKTYTLTNRGTQKVLIIDEKSIYRLVFKSRKKEAEQFQDWVFEVIKNLRQAAGLEGFEVFRMLDKEHQKQAMKRLSDGLEHAQQVDLIKANTIANKAVSNLYGLPKMVKKNAMSEAMLKDREQILDDTVELMTVKERYGLPISVSKAIYNRNKRA